MAVATSLLSTCRADVGQSAPLLIASPSSLPYSDYDLYDAEVEQFHRLSQLWEAGRETYVLFVSDFQEAMAMADEGVQVDDKKLMLDSLFAYREEDEQINNGYWMIFVEKES